ncbi:hypothetical protein ABPG72_017837 [Tetrahymena utriculariae]
MEKQNISYLGQDSQGSTKYFQNLNLLNKQELYSQIFQNQVRSPNKQNELDDTQISINSEKTLKREIKSQILRSRIGQNRVFENPMCQIINQNNTQHVILSYQNQQNQNMFKNLSSKNSNYQNFQSQDQNSFQLDQRSYQESNFNKQKDQIKQNQTTKEPIQNKINGFKLQQSQEKIDINLQEDKQQLNVKSDIIPEILNKQENNEIKKIVCQQQNQQIYYEQKILQQSDKIQQNSILELQSICKEYKQNSLDENIPFQSNQLENYSTNVKQVEQDKILKNQQQAIKNQQEAAPQPSEMQNNNKNYLISNDSQQKQNTLATQQEIESITNQQQFEINKSVKKLSYISSSYFSQLKIVYDKIEGYQFYEYEKKIELGHQAFQIKKEWNQEIFDRTNGKQFQSDAFQSSKQKIFQSLKEKQYYLCKIITSNQIEDLIVGFFQDEYENFEEYIFKINYKQFQSDIDTQNQIIKTLGLKLEFFKLEQEKISIQIIKKNNFLSISEKFEQLVWFKKNIQKLEVNYEINSQNVQQCKKCENQNTCENQNCFINIKLGILTFLQNKNYSYCEYQNKLINGIIFQLSQEKFVSEYLSFVNKIFFCFLESDQNKEQNTFQQQSSQLCDNISEKKQNFLNQESKKINIDSINEYSFKDYQVKINIDHLYNTNKLIPNYQREWELTKFNTLNDTKISEIFQKYQKDIIQILKDKQYFLCQSFASNQSEDIFIGYQEEIKEKYIDYIFVIKYNPFHSEIQKYLLVRQLNEEINHFIINSFIHVFILSKDAFLQIYNHFEQVSQFKVEWTKDDFEKNKKNKIINEKNCNK